MPEPTPQNDPTENDPTENSDGASQLNDLNNNPPNIPSDLTLVTGETSFLDRYSTLILCISIFFVPLICFGAVKSLKIYGNDIRQWLPAGFEEAETHDEFVRQFGVDQMLVATWKGCELDSPELKKFEEILFNLEIQDLGMKAGVGDHETDPVFDRILSGPTMLAELDAIGIKGQRARDRLQGLTVGSDGKTTCLIAIPSEHVVEQRKELVSWVYKIANEQIGIAPLDLHLAGPTVDGAAINTESQRSLHQFLWVTVGVVFLLTWFRLRDLPLSLIVLFFSVFCALVSLTILFWTGGKMNLTMVMLPTLSFILSVSACIHMVNYYRKASSQGYGVQSANQALKDAYYPVLLSSITTAIGMASLSSSQVAPIRYFGLYSAAGIIASLPVILLIVPAVLHFMRGRVSKHFGVERVENRRQRESGLSKSTLRLVHIVCRNHWWVVIPSLIALAVISIGIMRLEASVKLQSRFAQRTKIIQDYAWMEENLGPLVPMEVVIEVGPENDLSRWQQMQMVQSVERAIKQTTAVNATLSAATFEPSMPRGSSSFTKLRQKTVLKSWESSLDRLEESNLVRCYDDRTLWRISLRVAALNEIDYGGFIETINRNVDQQLMEFDQPDVSAVITGAVPLVYKAQHQILKDLTISFTTAFVFISLILMFVLRSVQAGLVAMIPNVFPPLIVFGMMGWLGRAIEIGSVMTASVALGIAVDDTIHFLTWYRRGTVRGMSRMQSIRFAFDHCAKAMIDTSVICGLGVAPFLLSVFMPTVRFSRMLLTLLFTALLGDLILLPAILAGPAGILFRGRVPQQEKETGPNIGDQENDSVADVA